MKAIRGLGLKPTRREPKPCDESVSRRHTADHERALRPPLSPASPSKRSYIF